MKLSRLFLLFVLLCMTITSCRDTELDNLMLDEQETQKPDAASRTSGALVPEESSTTPGKTIWKVKGERVPLVGIGRVVENISQGLVSVLGGQSGFDCVTDLDLTNSASLSGLNVNLLGNQLFSVKDMYRTYSGGQEVGFVLGGTGGGVLELNVLKLFVISLYNKGQLVHTANASEDGKTITVKLLSVGNKGTQALSIKAPDDVEFDEVMLATTGVADAGLNKVSVYYAFVGETPMEYVYKTQESYPDADANLNLVIDYDANKILDPNHKDGIMFGGGLELFTKYKLEVDLGKPVEEGTEIGFLYKAGTVLDLKLGSSIEVETFDAQGNKEDGFKPDGGLLGISAIGGGEGTYSLVAKSDEVQKINLTKFTALGLNAGGITVKRVFTRKPVRIDPTSYFTSPQHISTAYASYKFKKPEEGELVMAIIGGNDGENPATIKEVSGYWVINNMGIGKSYTVTATYTAPDERQFSMVITVERTKYEHKSCVPQPLTETGGWNVVKAGDYIGVDIIDIMQDVDNITDNNLNNYATNTSAINLLQHGTIAAVMHEDSSFNTEHEKKVVGFTVQNGAELLGLSATKFFRIKLYNKGTEVTGGVSDSNEAVSLGLLNGSRDKLRISIETDREFDCVALCTAGLLQVNLGTLRIYNAFCENVDKNCNGGENTTDACSEMMSPINSGLRVNYSWTKFSGVANVGGSFNNFSNVLDSDPETAVTIPSVLSAAGRLTFGLQFNTIKGGQWIGLMMKKPSGVADLDLLSNISIEIMNGSSVVEELNYKAGVLGLELIGWGEKAYLEAYPKYDFNGIRVNIASVASVGENYMFYGLYSLGDADGNGVPDCSENFEDGDKDVVYPDAYRYHVCEPDPLVMKFTGGITGKEYTFTFKAMDDENEIVEMKATMPANKVIELSTGKLQHKGYFLTMSADNGDGTIGDYPANIEVFVHPKLATWIGGVSGKETDWNTAGNWDNGIPWTCTDVVIPEGCTYYPVLKADDKYYCGRIQIKHGGEVVNTHYLNYESAWVDVKMKKGEYNMFSAPLKETYTGDMFVSNQDKGNFAWMDEKDNPANRFAPKVYQRMWNRSVQNAGNMDGGYVAVNPDDDFWTAPFNIVSQKYEMGQGILVRPGTDDESGEATFRFPKRHGKYQYYDLVSEKPINRWENIFRVAADVGRFAYEDEQGKVKFPLRITLENKRPGNMYLAGNPFMCHIDAKVFFEANPAVSEICFLKKNGNSYVYETWKKSDNNTGRKIAPATSFLVKVAKAYEGMYRYKFIVNYVEDMLCQK